MNLSSICLKKVAIDVKKDTYMYLCSTDTVLTILYDELSFA